jgi:hypothetical protein
MNMQESVLSVVMDMKGSLEVLDLVGQMWMGKEFWNLMKQQT